MDSQLATVLTSGSLDVQNGSQCVEGSGPVTEVVSDPKDKISSSPGAGNLQPCPVKAVATRQDALSINGKKPEVGGTCKPASQETSKIGGLRQPITVKTGVPGLRSQPIRIKIVVPPRFKRPITNSTISLTKDFACSHFKRPVLASAGAMYSEKDTDRLQISVVKNEGEIGEVHQTEEESLHSGEEIMCKDRDTEIVHTDESETFLSSAKAVKMLSQHEIKVESTESEFETNIPLFLQKINLMSYQELEEQTEPLDLSLPKKRESRERRYGRFLDDCGCESSLIMEVDEYDGEGDRDIVEEDDDNAEDSVYRMDTTHTLDPALSSSLFPTSLSSLDTENLLLIDDQGIPYTLSPDGLKVPQVDTSLSEGPLSDQTYSAEVEREGSLSQLPTGSSLSQSLDNALNEASDDLYPSPAPAADSPLLAEAPSSTENPEVFTSLITNSSQPCAESVPPPDAVLSEPSGISVPGQPIQILTNPPANAPVLLLSSSSSSPQLSAATGSLSLPLSVTQTPPGASTPMLLLLSSVTSSSGDSASTSTPIAVLDPSTGQLSQITAASAPVSIPLPSGQVNSLGSPLSTLSHPVIRLSHSNPPVILSGVNNSSAVLASHLSTTALQNDSLVQINSSDSNVGTEAISADEVSNESNKPSTLTLSSLHTQAATLTYDPSVQPSSKTEVQSPTSEVKFDSEHLPLDDHIYFSSTTAPLSPPMGPILPSGKLEHLDPLDPLSPAESPNAMGSRRVLYCQLCPRVFFYLSDLERHAITHSQKKPHVCQQCGKAFKRSSHLQRHKHIHTGQRNFVCPICAKRFREAGELQRHQRVHTGEKPYQCQLCHTRFAERNTLRRHTKRKHPYHQVAMEMLNERRDRGGGAGGGGGGAGSGGGGGGGGGVSVVQEEEETAEWYSSTVSNLENSESEMET